MLQPRHRVSAALSTHARTIAVMVCLCAAVAALGALSNAWEWVKASGPFHTLPTTFHIWDTEPLGRHWLLMFLKPADFDAAGAYHHETYVWLFSLYAIMKPLELAGVSYEAGQHGVIFLTFGLILALLWNSFAPSAFTDTERPPIAQAKLAALALLALAIVATLPAFWIASLVGDPVDQNWFLASLMSAYISVRDYRSQPLGRRGLIAAIGLALVAPVYTLFVVPTLWILGAGERAANDGIGLRWPQWRREATIVLLIGAASIALPYLMVRLGGFRAVGSDLFYRAGLDGDTTYFTSMVQAVFAPSGRRPWTLTPLPIAALLIPVAVGIGSRQLAARMLRQLLVATTPSLFMVAVFPQAVSIHPYIYDFGLIFPAAFCIAFWLMEADVREWLAERRALVLGLFIVLTALLVTSGIDLARLKHLKLP